MVKQDVQAAIAEVIQERLNTLTIVSVKAEREGMSEGDEILRITVVVDNRASDFEPKRLSSLVRYIRAKLAEMHETAFPLVSFMTKADAKALAA